MKGILAVRGYKFLFVTELVLDTSATYCTQWLLETFKQFQSLEKIHITLHQPLDPITSPPNVITLSHVQEMSLSMFHTTTFPTYFPQLFLYLRLPKVASLCVQAFGKAIPPRPLFPAQAFCDHLPNFTQLPELQVHMGNSSPELTFRSTS